MQYFQILNCNEILGTCCTDYGLVAVLDIVRKFFMFFQMVVPILLIVGIAMQLIKLVMNPDEKGGTKKLTNRILAALFCFLIPVLVDVVLGLLSSNTTFKVAECWEHAKISNEISRTNQATYINPYKDRPKSSFLINPDEYETGTKPEEITDTGNGPSTLNGSRIVVYAKQFVGKPYVFGGTWNGEQPYTPTDCSGFVQGVFKHFGIKLTRTTATQWADKSSYTLVSTTDIRAGDLVMYDGHVGILTGVGNEIIHAKNPRSGIVIDSDFRTCSSKTILGIMRIKGV